VARISSEPSQWQQPGHRTLREEECYGATQCRKIEKKVARRKQLKISRVKQASGTVNGKERKLHASSARLCEIVDLLLVAKRLDRIEVSGPIRRIKSETDADSRADQHTDNCPAIRKNEIDF
jgi:hypothetical protein